MTKGRASPGLCALPGGFVVAGAAKLAEEEGFEPGMAVRVAEPVTDAEPPFVGDSVGTGDATDEPSAHAKSENVSKSTKSVIDCLALTDIALSSLITNSMRKHRRYINQMRAHLFDLSWLFRSS